MPPPSNKPFALPDFVLDIADSTISLATPFGPVGFALEGNGKLSGGFKGRAAVVSPQLVPGRCAATNLRANVAVAVVARRPHIDGPVDARPLHLPGQPLRHRGAALRRQSELQRELHQHRRQRPDGDRDPGRGRQRPRQFRRRHQLQGLVRRRRRRGEAVGAEVAGRRRSTPTGRGSTALTRSASAAARSTWSATMPPTAPRSTRA